MNVDPVIEEPTTTPDTVPNKAVVLVDPPTLKIESADANLKKPRQKILRSDTAPKKKKPKAKRGLPDQVFHSTLLELLYTARKDTKLWADMRNRSKTMESIDMLLRKQPVYHWKKTGAAHYYISRHDNEDTVVAYILHYDPMAEYREQMKEFHAAMQNKRKKKLPEPKKPESKKKDFLWRIANKRGSDETEGHAPALDDAKREIEKRAAQFLV